VNCGCMWKKKIAINCGWLEVGISIINITTTNKMDNMQINFQNIMLLVIRRKGELLLLLYYYYIIIMMEIWGFLYMYY
jgi:hypothetical protein